MKTKTFKMYTDSGHGWLAVKFNLLCELNLQEQISCCSYIKGGTIYLEEDSDMSIFLGEYEKKFGSNYVIIVKNKNGASPIRSYSHYLTEQRKKEIQERLVNDALKLTEKYGR